MRWERDLVDVRAAAAARRALPLLIAHPVVSAELLAASLDVTTRSARTALHTLHERGIVEPYRPARQRVGRPSQLWVTAAIVDLVSAWGGSGVV